MHTHTPLLLHTHSPFIQQALLVIKGRFTTNWTKFPLSLSMMAATTQSARERERQQVRVRDIECGGEITHAHAALHLLSPAHFPNSDMFA